MSIALATYNGERFLQPLLDSLAAQTWLPDKLVVSDDGSTDQTLSILANFAAVAPFPVMVTSNPSGRGILNNFYNAFAQCDTDVIFYCDQDDIWHPEKLATITPEFGDPAVFTVIHRSRIVTETLEDTGVIAHAQTRRIALTAPIDCLSVHGFGHQMAMRMSVVTLMVALQARLAGSTSVYVNNFDRLIPFCAALLGKIVLRPEAFVDFRRHGESASDAGKSFEPRSNWGARATWFADGHHDSANLGELARTLQGVALPFVDRIIGAHLASAATYDKMRAITVAGSRLRAIWGACQAVVSLLHQRRLFTNLRKKRDMAIVLMILAHRLSGRGSA
ncbi:MAG: glycosyltransferase [Sphingomonadaceae bacterium]